MAPGTNYHWFMIWLLSVYVVIVPFTKCNFIDPIFDLKTGQTLHTTTAHTLKEVPIPYKCRQLCVESDNCIAFRTEPFSYRWKCYLFGYGPAHTLVDSTIPNGMCGVKMYPGSTLEPDGFYYIRLSTTSKNFTMAREDCKLATGYRLALIKTKKSYNAVMPKYKGSGNNNLFTVVDLEANINSGNVTFGDGTPYENSDVANNSITLTLYNGNIGAVFVLWSAFSDWFPDRQVYALCQGNPLSAPL